MPTRGDLLTVASIVAGFGIAVLVFRIQRELEMADKKGGPTRLPWADGLVIAATLISLWLVVLPLLTITGEKSVMSKFAAACCSAVAIMLSGYIPGILAHYRIIWGKNRSGPRENPEPAEAGIVIGTSIVALGVFVVALVR